MDGIDLSTVRNAEWGSKKYEKRLIANLRYEDD